MPFNNVLKEAIIDLIKVDNVVGEVGDTFGNNEYTWALDCYHRLPKLDCEVNLQPDGRFRQYFGANDGHEQIGAFNALFKLDAYSVALRATSDWSRLGNTDIAPFARGNGIDKTAIVIAMTPAMCDKNCTLHVIPRVGQKAG